MDSINADQLLKSLNTGFISGNTHSDPDLMPSLLVNDYKREKKILSALSEELQNCCEFFFSVAFINNDGIACIKEMLAELEAKGIKGRILTTNYLNFTEPTALDELMQFSNIELRVYTVGGFHPKGYIFRHDNYYSAIIGSANLTASALSLNQEWSIRLVSLSEGQIIESVIDEFERIWNDAEDVDSEWLDAYRIIYSESHMKFCQSADYDICDHDSDPYIPDGSFENQIEIIPNKMQKEAMAAIAALRDRGENRALLIAATGTGKTYLSIFDVAQMNPDRVLYVAHRDMILNKAEKSFKALLGDINTGFLRSGHGDYDADYLFASVFTLSKSDVLHSFKPDAFDYIIIDEVHHSGAKSYLAIIDYFRPKFMLGLTATPERNDGCDIFAIFSNNIPYEIRLKKAMEEDLLCPFHYYGISDLSVNGKTIDDKSEFSLLVSNERVKHIEKAIKLYRNFAYPVKGLMFCSRVDEAEMLSEKLNGDGFCTKALTGSSSDSEREAVIEALESDSDPLQYIISVDIFNEGVDIPSVNQIVMLRPTESAIIFTQQLGRGLRKYPGKSYVSVIDFIGNYENNFFIPIALFGDNSYDKDNIRKSMRAGSAAIPGASTIQINEIARNRIFESLSNTNFKQKKFLETEYKKLKMRLGYIPSMVDFAENGFIDPLLFIDYAGSYYEFLSKVERDIFRLSDNERRSLQFVSLEFGHGLRVHELLILRELSEKEEISIDAFSAVLKDYGVNISMRDIKGMCNTLSPDFYTEPDHRKYGRSEYVKLENDRLVRHGDYTELLSDSRYRKLLLDTVAYGLKRAMIKDGEKYEDHNFILYRKYSRKDVCKLLNWKVNITAQNIGGYIVQKTENELTCPVFVTYEKSEDISDSIRYDDYFIDNSRLNWMSKNKRTSSSPDVSAIIRQKENGMQIPLFVKKNDSEGTDFYYLGNMKEASFRDTQMMDGTNIVNVQFDMVNPVPQNLFGYIVK